MKSRPVEGMPQDAQAESSGAKKGEIVVFITRHAGFCSECGAEFFDGSFIRVEDGKPLCLDCADLGHLEFLTRGDAALTRRASKHSPLRAVVVQWARARKRYERQGVLVAPDAIDRAEAECAADEGKRSQARTAAARRREALEPAFVAAVTDAIRKQFPGCPAEEAEHIAMWTCAKGSGRIGRSAATKRFDSSALRLAVIAHIRHAHSGYDTLLMRCGDRQLARQQVYPTIDAVLSRWEQPQSQSGGG